MLRVAISDHFHLRKKKARKKTGNFILTSVNKRWTLQDYKMQRL